MPYEIQYLEQVAQDTITELNEELKNLPASDAKAKLVNVCEQLA
jgi:hypothetical protein